MLIASFGAFCEENLFLPEIKKNISDKSNSFALCNCSWRNRVQFHMWLFSGSARMIYSSHVYAEYVLWIKCQRKHIHDLFMPKCIHCPC